MRLTIAFLVLGLVACGDDDAMPGVDSGPGSDSGPARMCSTTDGTSACSSNFCPANEWCDVIICSAGCQSSANCASGMFCDKDGATGVDGAGVCRPCDTPQPDAGPPAVDSGPACSNIMGNYSLTQAAGNPGVCSELALTQFSATQSGTAVTLSAVTPGGVEQIMCTLDSSSCSCTGSFSIEGMSIDINWMPSANRLSVTAAGIICNLDVTGPA